MQSKRIVKVYPNPFANSLIIEDKGISAGQTVQVYDYVGKLRFSAPLHENTKTLNLSHLGQGLYFVKVTGNNQSNHHVFKILKK